MNESSVNEPLEINHAELDWDAEGQPLSRAFGDVYFSRANGLEETRHVFLQHNQLAERFCALAENSCAANPLFIIGETGFGSGLNFLAAWQLWLKCAPENARMHFISTEKFPLLKTDLERALALWPELAPFAQQLCDQYPALLNSGFHRLIFASSRITLTLIIDDAAAGFAQLLESEHPHFTQQGTKVDAWFLDGFAPAKNPQMWSAELFAVIGQLSAIKTTAATFSAAGIVKQGLQSAGFTVKKVAGFGRKREMVSAVMGSAVIGSAVMGSAVMADTAVAPAAVEARSARATPWTVIRDAQVYDSQSVIVIGGGLAGCHTAHMLAVRGWRVTLLERQTELAQEASGNPQGVLYAKISHQQEALALFNLASLQFALNHYRKFWSANEAYGVDCGVLQLAHTNAAQKLQQQLRETFSETQNLMRFVNAQEASHLAGVSLAHGGIFFPTAGWLDPRAICKALVGHPNIHVNCNSAALSLTRVENIWQVSAQHQSPWHAAVVVVANATDALQFAQTAHLPLKNLRGQVSYLPATPASAHLKTVICAEGYCAPATQSPTGEPIHCAGATFNIKDAEQDVRASDHQTNLDNLRAGISGLANDWTELDLTHLKGRVSFRCASPDYLPVVGPAPKVEEFKCDYAKLRQNARANIPLAGQYWPGLYVNLAHGSRGLAYTPLSAELLAAQITREPLPLSRQLMQALHPARFIIRDLQRNKP